MIPTQDVYKNQVTDLDFFIWKIMTMMGHLYIYDIIFRRGGRPSAQDKNPSTSPFFLSPTGMVRQLLHNKRRTE